MILHRLRDKINEQHNISYNKIYNKKHKEFRAWDKICAIMDRLDDTVDFLNELKLNTGKYKRSAFDFFEFMNNAAVIVDCIKQLAEIFNVADEKIKKQLLFLINWVKIVREQMKSTLNIYVPCVRYIQQKPVGIKYIKIMILNVVHMYFGIIGKRYIKMIAISMQLYIQAMMEVTVKKLEYIFLKYLNM